MVQQLRSMPGEPRSLPERRTDRWTIELIPNCPETTAPETPTPNHRFFKFFLFAEEPAGNHQLAQPTLAEPKLTPTETKPADGNSAFPSSDHRSSDHPATDR